MVKASIFFIEKISFSLKLLSGHFYGQTFIKTVRGPLTKMCICINIDKIYVGIVMRPFVQIYSRQSNDSCLMSEFR